MRPLPRSAKVAGVIAAGALLLVGARFVAAAGAAGTGFAAKQLCSLVFYSKIDPARARELYVDPVVVPLNWMLTASYDASRREVSVTSFRLFRARARMRDGLGCTLTTHLDEEGSLPPVELPPIADKPLVRATAADTTSVDMTEIDAAIADGFEPEHNTLAVTILHRGRIVAERYAAGISAETPLPGWSMAKSVTATLVGILVGQHRLDLHAPGAVQAWQSAADARSRVTLDQLLRMTSGMDVVETQSGADSVSQMLFVAPDAAAFVAGHSLEAPPGEVWEYSSGSTVLVAKIVVDTAGGAMHDSQLFMRRHLFAPLGLSTFVFEPDSAGTFIGSSFAFASAHDWAKLGQLYLDDGTWEGRRLLPEGWRDYVTRVTPASGEARYGAGFWRPARDIKLPADTFYASGFQGQYVLVIPSRELVIVRLGASNSGVWRLAERVANATPAGFPQLTGKH